MPELVPLRYSRMLLSPFAFFRGGAAIFAADMAATRQIGLRAQLCGDAHLMNFGLFDTPERTLVFGINDFDETLPGPIEWDVLGLSQRRDRCASARLTRKTARPLCWPPLGPTARPWLSSPRCATSRSGSPAPGRRLEQRLADLADPTSAREVKRQDAQGDPA